MSKITGYTELSAAPASGDYIPIVDVDDTTQSANGTTKKITSANLLANAGGSTPRLKLQLMNYNNPTSTGEGGFVSNDAAGTGAGSAWSNSHGWRIYSGTQSTGFSHMHGAASGAAGYLKSKFFDANPAMSAVFGVDIDNGDCDYFIGMGGSTLGTIGSDDGTAYNLIGLRAESRSGTVTWYAVNGNASTETTTDVTTTLAATTGWSNNDEDAAQTLYIEYTTSTNIKFYVNGTLLATHTTNLPTGAIATMGAMSATFVGNANGGTTLNSAYIKMIEATIDAY